MTLPVAPMNLPSDLKHESNGELSGTLLTLCGVGNFKMHHIASRAIKAMNSLLALEGHLVRSTGTYRTYAEQVLLFESRYTTTNIPTTNIKTWNGVKYYLRPGNAMAAVPGTSNHGLGLAIDYAEELDGDPQVESISTPMVNWLIKNAAKFGFSAETQSEPWHWRYVAGDKIPQAVIDFETPIKPPVGDDVTPRFIRQKGYLNVLLINEVGNILTFGPELQPLIKADYPNAPEVFIDHMPSFQSYCILAGLQFGDINSVVPGGPEDRF